MSPQEPTPQDDDGTAVIADAAEAYFEYLERDGYRLEGCSSTEAAAFIAKALKSAGYELVNQVGTVHHEPDSWQHIVGGPSSAPTATDNQVINPSTVELTARWIGERESTHTWPEIREDDKAYYRNAARHLLATIGVFREPIAKGAFTAVLKATAAQARADARAEKAERDFRFAGQNARKAFAGALDAIAPGATSAALAANNWLTRMLENINTVCVQLPEPDEHGCWYIDGTNDWLVHTGANGTGVFFETSVDLYEFAPDHAGNVAAALLAAKAKVEASE